MFQKLALILALVAVVALVAPAGTVPTGTNFRITLSQDSILKGTALKAGEYRLNLLDSKVTITDTDGKNVGEIAVQVMTAEQKFGTTAIRFDNATGKAIVSEIRLGGTKTRLVLN